MDRIATSQTYSSVLLGLTSAQGRAQQAGAEVSSGKVATDIKGYAASADTLTAAQAVKSRVDSYLSTNARLADKLTAQDTALNAVASSATDARQAVLSAIATGNGISLVQALQGAYAQATAALNTDYQGSYLFSGGNSQTPPVTGDQLSDLASGSVASRFTSGTFKATDRLDDSTTVQTGFAAQDVGSSLFSALQTIVTQNAATPFTGQLSQAQIDFLQAQLQPLQDAATQVSGQVAANGVNQNRVDAAKAVLTDRQTALVGTVSGITDADAAQAATNLQLAQTTLQASAQVFQTLSASSLLNLLSPS